MTLVDDSCSFGLFFAISASLNVLLLGCEIVSDLQLRLLAIEISVRAGTSMQSNASSVAQSINKD